MLTATIESYASARDQHPISGEVTYYGVLTNIIELCYSKDLKFILFECDWVDNRRGLIEKNSFGFALVNFTHLLYGGKQLSDEPFILSTQAQQAFYVQDPVDELWHIVIKMKPRDFFDMSGGHTATNDIPHSLVEQYVSLPLENTSSIEQNDATLVRSDIEGTTVDQIVDANLMEEEESDDSD